MRALNEKRWCVINGDDFGASVGINRAIVEAHTDGILTSASLMVNMPGAAEAAELSARYPDLSVGLHVNFTNEGEPVIPLDDVAAARAELARQYESFIDLMGMPPSHLDAHHNVHRHDHLRPVFRELAERENLFLREHSPVRYFSGFYGQWDGESHLEHIAPQQLLRMLDAEVGYGFTELACHPGYLSCDFSSEYGIERETEVSSLCSQLVRDGVSALGIELVNYHQVRAIVGDAVIEGDRV